MMQHLNVMYADIPKYLLAHSMGAAIASLYLLKYPHAIERAAFTAPMFGIQLGKKPKWFVKWVIHVGALFNRVDRKSTRLNSSHVKISYAVFCLKKKKSRRAACRTAK